MDRRSFLLGAAGAVASVGLGAAAAPQTRRVVGPGGPNGTPTQVYVDQPTVIRQQCPQWCWAASCAMIFACHGHEVDQQEIVKRAFGDLTCAPAPGIITAQVLSDTWTDVNGRDFTARITAAYDPQNGINAITNAYIVNELAQNRPLLYANKHHAMVLCTADYWDTRTGPYIQSMGVLDPWPDSPAYHPLTTAELYPIYVAGQYTGGEMTFLAAVHI